ERRFEAFAAISPVMPAGIRFDAGLARSIAPIENWVILLRAPVGVHDVSAIEFAQMMESTKMRGSEMSARSHGTPKNSWLTHAPATPKIGTPIHETHSGTSMSFSTSAPLSFFPPAIALN